MTEAARRAVGGDEAHSRIQRLRKVFLDTLVQQVDLQCGWTPCVPTDRRLSRDILLGELVSLVGHVGRTLLMDAIRQRRKARRSPDSDVYQVGVTGKAVTLRQLEQRLGPVGSTRGRWAKASDRLLWLLIADWVRRHFRDLPGLQRSALLDELEHLASSTIELVVVDGLRRHEAMARLAGWQPRYRAPSTIARNVERAQRAIATPT